MEQYSVLNGGTTVTLEDGTVSLQYIDAGNGNFQYIVDQKEVPVQYQQHNQVIGIDHIGTVQLSGYQQPVIIDNSTQQSVILVEEVEPQQQTLQQQQFMVPQQSSQAQHTFFTTQNTPNGMMLVPATMTSSPVAVVTSVVQPSLPISSEQQPRETELTNLITLNDCNQVQVEGYNSIQSHTSQPSSNQNSVIYTQHLVADEGGGTKVATNPQSAESDDFCKSDRNVVVLDCGGEGIAASSVTPLDPQQPVTPVRVPVSLCLAIVFAYICAGALLFNRLENWTFLEGSFFCFTSLGTIGFGDLVPGLHQQLSVFASSAYILLGMALVAMCFNLIQDEVVLLVRRLALHFGVRGSGGSSSPSSGADDDVADVGTGESIAMSVVSTSTPAS